MGRPSFQDLHNLYQELILPFYQIKRDMALPFENRRDENDAEHCWGLAFLGCALAPEIDKKLDTGKICQFAIVHDVVEIYAGDTSVWSEPKHLESKPAREAAAVKQIMANFSRFPWIGQTIEAYQRKDTPEAQFVYALDKFVNNLIPYINGGNKYIERKITKQFFDQQLDHINEKVQVHPAVAQYYQKLRAAFDAHPEFFYEEKS